MVYPIEPKVACVGDDVGIQFDYFIAGQSRTFLVTRQALQDHFGLQVASLAEQAREAALSDAFLRGWERIRNVAARARGMPIDNRVVLESDAFQVS